MKTFLEVTDDLQMRMTTSQKRVLRKVKDTSDPQMAASNISQAEDSRNLIGATRTLAKYGYVETNPPVLGPQDEPKAVSLTDKGEEAAENYDVQNDDRLVTPEEQKDSAPEGEQPAEENPKQAGSAEDSDLQLSSFFKDVNDLAKLNG